MADWFAQKGAPVSTCTAALLGLDDVVKKALAADRLSINERGAHDLPLLAYTAYAEQQAAIAEMLLNAGAKVDVRAFGLTILHLAAMKGHVELAELLIARGADVNLAVKSRGDMVTPLGLAVKAKQQKMEQLLKDRGGKV
jgi:ankyrin repeat protein